MLLTDRTCLKKIKLNKKFKEYIQRGEEKNMYTMYRVKSYITKNKTK